MSTPASTAQDTSASHTQDIAALNNAVPDPSKRLRRWIIVGAVLAIIGFVIAFMLMKPAPPSKLTITTGASQGAYYTFAVRYQKALAKHGVKLEILTSTGSVNNLDLLQDPTKNIDVGFVQSGTASGIIGSTLNTPDDTGIDQAAVSSAPLVSIASLYYEPMWIFQRGATAANKLTTLSQLKGLRIAIGPRGSGRHRLAIELLRAAGIGPENSTLNYDSPDDAAAAYAQGKIDILMLLGSTESRTIKAALDKHHADLMSLTQATGITRHAPYLSVVTLTQGAVDLQRNIPAQDITMISTTANLVARDALHPALVYLLLDTASQVHKGGSIFNEPGVFPSSKGVEFPLAEEAVRYAKSGKPFLQRYLPYWLANFIDRALILLIPLFAIVIPLAKGIPDVYGFRVKNKVGKWYDELSRIEIALGPTPDLQAAEKAAHALDELESQINNAKIPGWFINDVFALRGAIDLVRERLGRSSHKALATLRNPSEGKSELKTAPP